MIDHISFGVRDLARSRRFYDAVLTPLGYSCLHASDAVLGYGAEQTALWLTPTETPVVADPSSGLHVCFAAPNRRAVQEFHKSGLSVGGTDNGGPGMRPEYSADYFAAFLIDPDGYRVEAYNSAAT